jgi:hypothetical protein
MFQLKNGTQVIEESATEITYIEDQKGWLTPFHLIADTTKSFVVVEVADPEPQDESAPSVIG